MLDRVFDMARILRIAHEVTTMVADEFQFGFGGFCACILVLFTQRRAVEGNDVFTGELPVLASIHQPRDQFSPVPVAFAGRTTIVVGHVEVYEVRGSVANGL